MRLFIFINILAGMLTSCGKDQRELFVVENEIDFVLPAGLNTIETHVFVIRDVPTFFSENLNVFGYQESDVAMIGAGRASIRGTFQNINYDFIGEIAVRGLSQQDPSLNREMFFRENIPFNQSGDLELLSSISNLTDILKESFIDIEIRIRLRQFVPAELRNKLIFSYAVFDSE